MTTPHDRELERLLDHDGGEFAALYRRLPRAEPPRRLDRSVIAEAARAVHGQTPRRQRWLVGFGSAAGLLLAAGIAWHVGQDALRRQQSEPATQRVVPVQPIRESPLRRNEPPAPPRQTTGAAAITAAPEATAPARQAIARPAPSPTPAATPAPFPASPAQRDEAAAGAETPSEAVPTAKSARAEATSNPAPATERAQSNAPATPSGRVDLHRGEQPAAADWLAHIRQLLREGHRQQALASLHEFRRAYPQQALPDDLRDLGE